MWKRLRAAWRALRGPAGEGAELHAPAVRWRAGAMAYARVAGVLRPVQLASRAPAGWLVTYDERTARGGRSGLWLVREHELLTAGEAAAIFQAEAARTAAPPAGVLRFSRAAPPGER